MEYIQILDRWLENVQEEDLLEELRALKVGDPADIEDAFYQELAFGTGGLRGVLGAGANRMNVYTVGKAAQGIADYLNAGPEEMRRVAICYDSRINSQLFAKRSAQILAANGITAYIYPRLEPTPALSFATRHLKCGIGINVTASHNPSVYNGYKVYGPDGCQIEADIADAITEAINKVDYFDDVACMDFDEALSAQRIHFMTEEVLDAYLDAVESQNLFDPASADTDLSLAYTPLHGTGLECVTRILERIGVENVTVVEQQAQPDGNFPTCPYPNPEVREALELGLELCEKVGADLLIATDPDADRVGTAVRNGDEYELLTGNELGALLFDYVCAIRTAQGTMPDNPVLITTNVSTDLVDAIAADYGVEVHRVLTGFKYIGADIADMEAVGHPERFIFGFEESYGYLAGTHARDKDAIVTTMLVCQMARYHKAQGRNLIQAMKALYEKYGYYRNQTLSYTFGGAEGAQTMTRLMDMFRNEPPAAFAGYEVVRFADYLPGIEGLPSSNMMAFELTGGNKLVVRPSGTEPKLKVYLFTRGADPEEATRIAEELTADINAKVG